MDIRLEEFRQLKKEIRGSKEYLIVGIDVAKEKHHAFFGTATGKTLLKRLIFDNTIEGFRKLLVQVEAIQVAHGSAEGGFWIRAHGQLSQAVGRAFNQVRADGGFGFRGSRQTQPGAFGWALGQT